ncbi:tRNA uracil 4-sulfurtransferase ThiI [Cohnella nanjingensis]|uniref:Probable tRNA sulfurtransferase n=1 Tax=Cohnella nanjingensis TaxID=1387779 RepID=A0A7X0VIJ9_9BACL|nr:tRNA uracil 4-sulfurtransferase ThiI [Cohnella nanjingensis]MBB6675277.1 tRNA 4-thiouridine(8) synthase ThiI [Cohnella nanjingensis]
MYYDYMLVRLGELTIKGRNRGKFENLMLAKIKQALTAYERLTYEKSYGRVYITLNGEDADGVSAALRDVFGIGSFSPAVRAANELGAIREAALAVMNAHRPAPATFKMTVKRAWKEFPHVSQEMNHLVGAHVLRNTPALKVNIREPDVELKVDIQPQGTFVYCTVVPGAGGFPLGMNGKAMLLLSGGIDSPVAGWMAMRKGLEIEAIHFHSYPFTSEQATEKVVTLTQRLAHYGGRIKLHLVPFTELQTRLAQSKQDHLIITLMRRAMLRIAQKLAEQRGALALVTGDSLGQVASQTLGSMNVIGREIDLPLLRPLVMMDKQEIIRYAERIGTYETSILPYEDCCTLFVPKSPATNPNLRVVESVEHELGEELNRLIEEAVAGTELVVMTAQGREGARNAEEDRWF